MQRVIKFRNGELHPNVQLNRDLRQTGALDPELRRRAELAALGAKEIAVREFFGVDSHTGAIGAYYASIHAGVAKNSRGLTVGRVSADDWKAHWAENPHRLVTRTGQFVRQVPGRKILARGARRAGLKVRASRSKHTRPEQ